MFSFNLLFFIQYILGFQLSGILSSLEKCPGRRRVEEKDFRSVIQRHRVNASILFLTTSVNCRSDSPTHSTFSPGRRSWDTEIEVGRGVQQKMLQLPVPHTVATSHSSLFHWELVLRRTYAHLQRRAGGHTNTARNKAKIFNKQW